MDSVDTTALERVVFNTRIWHGAAIMAAYWSARGQGLVRSPGFMLPPSPGPSPNTPFGSASSQAASQPASQLQLSLYHPAAHPHSVGSVLSSYPLSAESGDEKGGRRHSGSGQLCPARSDPAIAATGEEGGAQAGAKAWLRSNHTNGVLAFCTAL
jgi:hypothetical protein